MPGYTVSLCKVILSSSQENSECAPPRPPPLHTLLHEVEKTS